MLYFETTSVSYTLSKWKKEKIRMCDFMFQVVSECSFGRLFMLSIFLSHRKDEWVYHSDHVQILSLSFGNDVWWVALLCFPSFTRSLEMRCFCYLLLPWEKRSRNFVDISKDDDYDKRGGGRWWWRWLCMRKIWEEYSRLMFRRVVSTRKRGKKKKE